MNAELKELSSTEVECPLEQFVPETPDFFEVTITALIGPANEDGAELFRFEVCTPKWLQARCDQGEIVQGRHTLVVGEFNFAKIRTYLIEICKICSGDNWDEVSLKLSRFGYWEFEDYQPYAEEPSSAPAA